MASAVVGNVLMVGILVACAGPVMLWANEFRASVEANADVARAERERAEEAARCARDPACDPPLPLDRYSCAQANDVWVCREKPAQPAHGPAKTVV